MKKCCEDMRMTEEKKRNFILFLYLFSKFRIFKESNAGWDVNDYFV